MTLSRQDLIWLLLFVLIILLALLVRCKRCVESFVDGGSMYYGLCNQPDYLTQNPYKYDPENFQSEISDEMMNTYFARVLIKGVSLTSQDPEEDLDVKRKIIDWINSQNQLRRPTENKFSMYDFEKTGKHTFRFTLHREKKNHGKVISAIVVSKKGSDEEQDSLRHVLISLKVIGYKPEYDIVSDLNKKSYGNIRFRKLEDRWQITEDEKIYQV